MGFWLSNPPETGRGRGDQGAREAVADRSDGAGNRHGKRGQEEDAMDGKAPRPLQLHCFVLSPT